MARSIFSQTLINYGKHLPTAVAANLKYGFPGKKIKVIGVTGTDGKTTTVNMIYQILSTAGKKVSMLSTINALIAGKSYDTGFHVTSPSPQDIQKFLKMAIDHGDEYFILEITSHGLDQFRAWGVPFEVGVITNITREHLDYHKTFERYVSAKSKLIQHSKYAVLNKDDQNFDHLSQIARGAIFSFSLKGQTEMNLKKLPLKLKLPGDYNLSNALAAASVATILGVDKKVITKALENFSNLNGRMEKIENKKGLNVIVDFGHTPNALEQALQAVKEQTKGKVISVFGAASQRDVGKRPIMGQVSARFADITVLTSEDPRFEDPNQIIDQIANGATALGAKLNQTLFKEADRKKAIAKALELAKKGDSVVIFGKGHEQTMNIKGVEKPWSDQKVASELLNGKSA